MHKHYSKGFTIVELLVIVVMIIIIATISSVTYIQLQKESRDSKRSADVLILMYELEKFYDSKGDYPPGCPNTTCTSSLYTANTSVSAPITSTTTTADLKTLMPKIPTKFGDPLFLGQPPMGQGAGTDRKYFYFGGLVNNTTTSYVATVSTPAPVCSIRSTLAANQISSYVAGYFSEKDNQWVLTSGRNGIQMTVASGLASDGCVIIRG